MKYRKKPVVIEGVRLLPVLERSAIVPSWLFNEDIKWYTDGHAEVRTLEGTMRAEVGDWLIRGVKGEVYPCKNDIFEATYEPVE